jgi:ketol-acid reductoisomerase
MAQMYYDKDCNFGALKNKTVAVIGYGSQGHAHALNLKDSGATVIIGLYEGSKSAQAAEDAGLTVMLTADAVKAADVVMILVNDEKQAALYAESIAEPDRGYVAGVRARLQHPLRADRPAADVNVIMIAPKGPVTRCVANTKKAKAFLLDRGVSGCRRQRERDRARVRIGRRRRPRRYFGNHLP